MGYTLCHSLTTYSYRPILVLFSSTSTTRPMSLLLSFSRITPVLFDLHWLPISERIKFKIILLTRKALHQQSPIYIQDLIRRYSTSRTLRSSSTLRLTPVKFYLKSYGYRAFTVSVPELWNKLPDDIRSCDNLNLFKRKLKTHLFKNYFNA